jgi:hypothetical protein
MFKKLFGLVCWAALIAWPSTAGAESVTFRFQMPAFQNTGETSILDVTVDNGSAGTSSQTYLNTQIIGMSATVGAQRQSFNSTNSSVDRWGPSLPYITTDAIGVPTLDLSALIDANVFFHRTLDAIGLGTRSGSGPANYLVVIDGIRRWTVTHAVVTGTQSFASRCVVPDRTDPETGLPLELPISRDTPVCHCFESGAAREWHCGILHPDFIAIRRVPLPLRPGRPYEEIWTLVPLGELDENVRVTIRSDGFEKPVDLELPAAGKLPADHTRPNLGAGPGQTFTLNAMAPDKPASIPGVAVFEYDMKDAKDDSLKSFGLDISLEKSLFKQ